MANLARAVAPGGRLYLACLRDTDSYLVGDAMYPCARMSERTCSARPDGARLRHDAVGDRSVGRGRPGAGRRGRRRARRRDQARDRARYRTLIVAELLVGRALEHGAVLAHAAQVVEHVGREDLAGGDDRNARGIGGDGLARDRADGARSPGSCAWAQTSRRAESAPCRAAAAARGRRRRGAAAPRSPAMVSSAS